MIRSKTEGNLFVITLDRPDKANALTASMLDQLVAALDEAAAGDFAAVILTGEGKVFSAGADLEEARAGLARDDRWGRLSARLASMPCLTIAALNGTLAGGAFGMALACDIRIAVAGAKFFYPAMKLGFLPQPADPPRMVRLIGPSRTKMVLMAGAKIDAQEALDWGLIDSIVADQAALTDTVRQLAADALGAGQERVIAIKSMIDTG